MKKLLLILLLAPLLALAQTPSVMQMWMQAASRPAVSAAAPSTLGNNLLAYFDMDDNPPSDKSGGFDNGYGVGPNGSYINTYAAAGPGGQDVTEFLTFGAIRIDAAPVLNEFSVNIWVKELNEADPTAFIAFCNPYTWGPPFQLFKAHGIWGADYASANTAGGFRAANDSGDHLTPEVWHMLTVNVFDTVNDLYIDGVLVAQSEEEVTAGALNAYDCMMLGGSYGDTYEGNTTDALWETGLEGYICLFGIWNRVLTTGEITELYNSGAGLSFSDFTP